MIVEFEVQTSLQYMTRASENVICKVSPEKTLSLGGVTSNRCTFNDCVKLSYYDLASMYLTTKSDLIWLITEFLVSEDEYIKAHHLFLLPGPALHPCSNLERNIMIPLIQSYRYWYAILYDPNMLKMGKYFIARFSSKLPGQLHWEGPRCPHHLSPLKLLLLPFTPPDSTLGHLKVQTEAQHHK